MANDGSAITLAAPMAKPVRAPGSGSVTLDRVDGRTAITGLRADSPLRLLSPRGLGDAAWIVASTLGGGLLAGDAVDLTLIAAPNTVGLLTTQASTKIYSGDLGSRQSLHVTAGERSLVVVAPDPVTPFAGSRYDQRQRFDLVAGASLLLIDSLTSGRRARGERWAFSSYRSANDVFVDGRHAYRDALLLDGADGRLAGSARVGGYDCFATVLLMGPRLRSAGEALLAWTAAQPIASRSPLLFAASALRDGIVLRVAGRGAEMMTNWIRERLTFVPEMLGGDPWSRKW